jgi:hypothetical protein
MSIRLTLLIVSIQISPKFRYEFLNKKLCIGLAYLLGVNLMIFPIGVPNHPQTKKKKHYYSERAPLLSLPFPKTAPACLGNKVKRALPTAGM